LFLTPELLMPPLSPLTIKDGFAFNITTGESYSLNSCAQIILQRLKAGENSAEIGRSIASEFGVTQSIVDRDITDFCQQLRRLGLQAAVTV
jgi:Coenzyme PQQ synthesis protein D (PqqD)